MKSIKMLTTNLKVNVFPAGYINPQFFLRSFKLVVIENHIAINVF